MRHALITGGSAGIGFSLVRKFIEAGYFVYNLDIKKSELADIVSETEKEEQNLLKKSEDYQRYIEERLLTAYKRIRKNARNGL
ncbi:MAG: SDR family NAD(P)-dependent oxidoreductase, partial [Bacteroidia bacterium]|nr:SDR family NAD(P)-dependent oxidoreductase [Bacteroidia bacterium]